MFKKSEVDLIACVQMSPLPQKKIGRRNVCESLSLIVFRLHLHKLFFLFFSLTVEKVLTDQHDSGLFKSTYTIIL